MGKEEAEGRGRGGGKKGKRRKILLLFIKRGYIIDLNSIHQENNLHSLNVCIYHFLVVCKHKEL